MCILNLGRKSDDIWPSNKTGSRPNFPSFQPYWRYDPITALASRAFIQIFVCKEVLNICCLNVASQGGSLIKLESTCGQFNVEPVQVAMTAFWLSIRIIQPWYQFSTDVNRIIYVCVRYHWQVTELIGYFFQCFRHRFFADSKERCAAGKILHTTPVQEYNAENPSCWWPFLFGTIPHTCLSFVENNVSKTWERTCLEILP